MTTIAFLLLGTLAANACGDDEVGNTSEGDASMDAAQREIYDEEGRVTKWTRDDRTDEVDALYVVNYEYLCPDQNQNSSHKYQPSQT